MKIEILPDAEQVARRAAALVAFITGLAMMLLNPPSFAGVGDLLALLAGIVAVVLITAWLMVMLLGDEMPEREFRRIAERSEALAKLPPPEQPLSEFDELVVAAIDGLPPEQTPLGAALAEAGFVHSYKGLMRRGG